MGSLELAKIAILCWEEGHVPRGLLQLETLIGNSTNLETYPFPVKICRIKGANVETILENPSEQVLGTMIEESRKLVDEGVQAITTSCGFNAVFQKELNRAVPVPVFTSSLLQIPFVENFLPKGSVIGVITAKKSALKKEHLVSVGILQDTHIEIFGMDTSEEWNRIFTDPDGDIDLAVVRKEVVQTAVKALEVFPSIGAFVLECTDLPPFSQAIRVATGKPVYDFQTMMGIVARSVGILPAY